MNFGSLKEISSYIGDNPIAGKSHLYHPIPFEEFKELSTSSNVDEVYRKWDIIKNIIMYLYNDTLRDIDVLDIGANAGFYTFSIAKEGAKVTAFEPNKEYSQIAENIINIEKGLNINWINEFYDCKKVKDKKIDVALMLSVFQWMADGGKNIDYAIRQLKETSKISKYLIFELGFNQGSSCLKTENKNHYEEIIKLLKENTQYQYFNLIGITELWNNCNRFLVICSNEDINLKLFHEEYSCYKASEVFEVDINKCISSSLFSFGREKESWHYFIETLKEYELNKNISYEKSILKKYYNFFSPNNFGEFLFGNEYAKFSKLYELPSKSYIPLPWTDIEFYKNYLVNNVKLINKNGQILSEDKVREYIDKNKEIIFKSFDNLIIPNFSNLDNSSGSFHLYGKQTDEAGKKIFKDLIEIYESIKNLGYCYNQFKNGLITGILIKNKEDYRFIAIDGQHRLASINLLGLNKVTVKLDTRFKYKVINVEGIEEWDMVKYGLYDKDLAKKFVDLIFGETDLVRLTRIKKLSIEENKSKEKVIFFGASNKGKIYLDKYKHKYDVVYFSDNDENKWGKYINNIKIISPKEIKKFNKYKVLITSQYYLDIARQLISMNVCNFEVIDENLFLAK
ncbi:MAG: methyltransferase domain-containing protein [Clostridiaceae bacterium]